MLRGRVAPFVKVVLLSWKELGSVACLPLAGAAAKSATEKSKNIKPPNRIVTSVSSLS
jgi:hypothetical protein